MGDEVARLRAENAAMRAALEVIRDPELAGRTWPELVRHLRLDPAVEVAGDDYITAQGSCWRYACLADAALRGVPPGEQEPRHPNTYTDAEVYAYLAEETDADDTCPTCGADPHDGCYCEETFTGHGPGYSLD